MCGVVLSLNLPVKILTNFLSAASSNAVVLLQNYQSQTDCGCGNRSMLQKSEGGLLHEVLVAFTNSQMNVCVSFNELDIWKRATRAHRH